MKVLLTGATGYIGRRLKQLLLDDPRVDLRLFVSNRANLSDAARARAEVIEGTTFQMDALRQALAGVDVAYYLIHSMAARGDFAELDRRSARNFIDACRDANVRRVIYLGGLGAHKDASKHLKSRHETGEILSAYPGNIRTIWFRAGAIIGSGSASFEIIHHLVQKLPVMLTPTWVRTKTEPIGIRDVLSYLHGALDLPGADNLVVDIGSRQMTFQQMLQAAARVMGLRRLILPVPLFSPKLSSYWLILITPVPYGIASSLVMGLKTESIKQNDMAARCFPEIVPESYEAAVQNALIEIEQNQVISRWTDSIGRDRYTDPLPGLAMEHAVCQCRAARPYPDLSDADVFAVVQAIGGQSGWYRYHLLWRIRGAYDKFSGGCGLNRGRRDRNTLRVGDCLDFWRVIDITKNRRLLLFGEARLPGKGWLELITRDQTLTVTAYFLPNGLLGRLYWYGLLPVHKLIFRDLARQIVRQSRNRKNSGISGKRP